MKQSIQIKLLVGCLLILSIYSFAQQRYNANSFKTKNELTILDQKTIKLDLAITVNNKAIDDTSYVLEIVNYNTGINTYVKVSNNFILFLEYDTEFEISISYKGTNMKTIIVNTNAPRENWYIVTGINLSTLSKDRIHAGTIKYNDSLKTFKKYGILNK